MITLEQCHEAEKILAEYDRQINPNAKSITVREWLSTLNHPMADNIMVALTSNVYPSEHGGLRPFKYMYEIKKRHFLRCRGVGIAAWNKFCEMAKDCVDFKDTYY